MWRVPIFETRTGGPVFEVSERVSAGTWVSRLNGNGTGSHTLNLFGSNLTGALAKEITRGNKYTIAQIWGTHVAYAGVLGDGDWDEASSRQTVQSIELRAALGTGRATFGVNQYDPDGTTLTITNRSHSGAVRAIIQAVTAPSSEWQLPIDLPADGAGGFSASWKFEEKLTWEDLIAQVEDDGCEVYFRPYLTGAGTLRWETIVASKITRGIATDYTVRAPLSSVTDLKIKTSVATLATGVLAFGKGQGQDTPYAYAPMIGSGATDQPVRDVIVTFPDIEAEPGAIAPGRPGYVPPKRLQDAADAEYERLREPIEQWSFGVHTYPQGPADLAPASLMRCWVYGSARITDGAHMKRVIALAGDFSTKVTPEVQDG